MKKHRSAVLLFALLLAACGENSDIAQSSTTSAAPRSETTTTVAAREDPTMVVTSSAFGDMVADQDGRARYVFLPDDKGSSVCYDQCAATWPPFTERPTAGAGLVDPWVGVPRSSHPRLWITLEPLDDDDESPSGVTVMDTE